MALMTSRPTETVPSGSASLWKVTLRMMRLTLAVGMRTESAMKPMLAIWGMTCSSAAAALVEVSTTLPMAPRLLRRSVAPAFGTVSSTGWDGVTACTVLIPAVIMFFVRSRSSSGRIMWASAVVVHDAAETSLCMAGSNSKSLMPWMRIAASLGQRRAFCVLLNGELCSRHAGAGGEVAAEWRPWPSSGSACGSRNVPVHSTTSDTPWSRQGMSFGSRASRRTTISLPWALMRPRSSSTTWMSRTPAWPKQEAVQRAVRAVLGDVLHDRVERRAHRPADVDDDAVEVVASQVMPQRRACRCDPTR